MITSDNTIRAILTKPLGSPVQAHGWIKTRRDSKGIHFIQLNDGSSFQDLQIVIESTTIPEQATTGACVRVTGELIASPGAGQPVELKASEIHVYGPADPATYPLQKKGHTMEFLREIAHLRPRTNTFGAVTRIRSKMAYAIHSYFQDRGFYYIHTPIISSSDAEGAGNLFRVSSLDFDRIPKKEGRIDWDADFFATESYLTVSGQLEGELLASALGDVYTFGPTFRAENSNTSRHAAEFWMIEPEMAWAELSDNMDVAEDFLKYLFRYALEKCTDEMDFFGQWIDKEVRATLEAVAGSEFERMPYTEAISVLEKSGEAFQYPVSWGLDLQSEHERFLTEKVFKKPVILYDYPAKIKAFYMRMNDDGKTVRAMDVLVPKVGEIIGGSQREERHDVLLQRMKDSGIHNLENYQWYL